MLTLNVKSVSFYIVAKIGNVGEVGIVLYK